MKREDIDKLLGGYATDTLTDEERRQLFAAALEDQKLFDSLADEEALRATLSDDATRRELLTAVRPSGQTRSRRWVFSHAFQAAAACAALLLVAVFVVRWRQPVPLKQTEFAMVRTAQAPVPPSPVVSEPPQAKPAAKLDAPRQMETEAKAKAATTSPALSDSIATATPPAANPAPPTPPASAAPAPVEQAASFRQQQRPMQQMAGSPSQVQLERGQSAGRLGAVSGLRREAVDVTAVSAFAAREGAALARLTRRVADGSDAEIAPGETVDRSERVQLQLRAPETGQIQVIMHDSSGDRVIHAGPVSVGQLLAINVPLEGPAGPREVSMVIAQQQNLRAQQQRKNEQLAVSRDDRTVLVRFAIR